MSGLSKRRKIMDTKLHIMNSTKFFLTISAITVSSFLGTTVQAAPEAKQDSSAATQTQQKQFNTPKEAADSLVQAAESFDVNALKEILGPDSTDIVASEVNQYAQRIISTPGKHDGLAWKNADGTWGGPVGEGVARALEQGYSKQGQPFHGYYFKVLKGQGPAASMGEMDFMVGDAMIGGFALAAAPAEYRVTGVKTFIVGPNGVVYEKDLGKDTQKAFETMDRYNPDKTWKETDDDWSEDEE